MTDTIRIVPLPITSDYEKFRIYWMGQTRIAQAKDWGFAADLGYSFKAEKLYAIVRALEDIAQSEGAG